MKSAVASLSVSNLIEDIAPVEVLSLQGEGESSLILDSPNAPSAIKLPPSTSLKLSKSAIRLSLKASTYDGVFAAIFVSITSGVLLSNFLLQLGANPVQIGMLSSMPMLVNLLQPLGAFLADRTKSRQWYNIWIFGSSRLLWLMLALGIGLASWHHADPHQLISWTLIMVLATNVMGALGSASWLSWMAALVPQSLRGRYFGSRNSASSFTTLMSVPLLGLMVSSWPGGTIQGYGMVLFLGVVAGIMSLICQFFMTDINPQKQKIEGMEDLGNTDAGKSNKFFLSPNSLKFLLYFGLWAFSVNVSAPFFNLYLLDDLAIDVSWVTIYSSIMAGANLLMLMVWGKLADRFGNRPLLVMVGILVAVIPLFWLGTGNNTFSLWIWFPLLHLVMGGTWAAIDLCSNNIQMGIAPKQHYSTYFGIMAAVAGVSGALGTTFGGFLAEYANYGGLPGLFALSAVLRLVALLPLLFVQEQRSQGLRQVIRLLVPVKTRFMPVQVVNVVNQAK